MILFRTHGDFQLLRQAHQSIFGTMQVLVGSHLGDIWHFETLPTPPTSNAKWRPQARPHAELRITAGQHAPCAVRPPKGDGGGMRWEMISNKSTRFQSVQFRLDKLRNPGLARTDLEFTTMTTTLTSNELSAHLGRTLGVVSELRATGAFSWNRLTQFLTS